MSSNWSVHLRYLEFGYTGTTGLSYFQPEVDLANSTETLVYFKDDGNRFTLSFVGYTFVAWDANNKGMSSLITGVNMDGGEVESFELESSIIPFGGYTYSILDFGDDETFFYNRWEHNDISQYVSSVRFDTDITKGFVGATISLDNYSSIIARILGRMDPVDVMIYDEYGERVYNGLVIGSTIDGHEGELLCSGYSITNEWFFAVSSYPAEDDSVTAPAIIKDQMMQNHYLLKLFQHGIDPGDVLATAQSTDGTYDGIGPFDFEDTPTTVQEAFDNVTKFGYYPEDPYKDYFLQIWFDRILVGKPVNRVVKDDDEIKWVLDHRNLNDDYSNVAFTSTYGDIRTSKRLVYTDTDGDTQRTQSAHAWPLTNYYGNMEEQATSSSLGAGRAYDVLRESVVESPSVIRPDNIRVTGLAQLYGGGMRRPVYHIRAGDIIEVKMPMGTNYPYPNSMNPGFKLIVGKTSYASETNTLTITAHSKANILERQLMVSDLRDS